jgi:hypothetical protein
VAKDAKGLKEAVTRSYPMKDGSAIRLDAILIAVPCDRDLKPLARAGEADAIKRAGGR